MTKQHLDQIDKRIGKIKVELAAIGEMRQPLTRQYKHSAVAAARTTS